MLKRKLTYVEWVLIAIAIASPIGALMLAEHRSVTIEAIATEHKNCIVAGKPADQCAAQAMAAR